MKTCRECRYNIPGDAYGCCSLTHHCVYQDKEHDCKLFNLDLSPYDICFNCKYYGGGNDWGLFCSHSGMYHHLGKFNDNPCEYYIRKKMEKHTDDSKICEN